MGKGRPIRKKVQSLNWEVGVTVRRKEMRRHNPSFPTFGRITFEGERIDACLPSEIITEVKNMFLLQRCHDIVIIINTAQTLCAGIRLAIGNTALNMAVSISLF